MLSLKTIKKYEPETKRLKVSEVARSPRGYLTALKKVKKYNKLSPEWKQKQRNFVARHLVQYKKNPTYRHRLALIAWSFDPDR
jgi:hypothetical protein